MTSDEPADYWAVNNHAPDSEPTGRPEIHAGWTAARESLAADMANWAAHVDGQADRVHRGDGGPTMTERVDKVIGDELANLRPGSAHTTTFLDEATLYERTFTLAPMPSIPTFDAAPEKDRQRAAHWVDRLGPGRST